MSSLTILFFRNTEVLLPNFLWLWKIENVWNHQPVIIVIVIILIMISTNHGQSARYAAKKNDKFLAGESR